MFTRSISGLKAAVSAVFNKAKGRREPASKMTKTAMRLSMSGLICAVFTASAQAGPFTCDGEIYQVQSGQLRIFDPIVSSYVDVGPQQGAYNATGFNTQDNFGYAAQGQDIIRIHSDGTIEDVFTNIGHTSFSGDVDGNNTLWLRRANNRYIGYDLATGAANDITFTGSLVGVADAAYFPSGGTNYLIGYASGDSSIFNLDNGTVVRRDVSGLPGGAFGATWTDFNGRIFTFNNGSGEIFEVFNPLSANPSAVLVAQGDPSGSNDGFSCNQAPFPNLPPLAFDDDYVTPLDTPVVSNVIQDNGNGADEDPENLGLTVTVLPISGTGPSNGSVTFSPNGDFTYTPNTGFFGTDTFDYTVTDISGLTASATVTILIEKPEMTLTKTASKTTDVNAGDVITYTYIVNNTGNVTLNAVSVSDVHSGTGTLGTITPASVSLNAGQSRTFTADYTVTQADIDAGTAITNTATASATPVTGTVTEPTADESIALTAPSPEALFSKLASPDEDAEVGDTITYSYTVENTGNITLNNVTVTDSHSGSGALSAITPAPLSLAPGETQVFTATYVITQADVDAAVDITNTAEMSADPVNGTLDNLEATEAVTILQIADLETVKTVTSGNPNPRIGDVVTFDITVTNNGPHTAANVSLIDLLPSNLIAMPDNGTVTAGTYNDVSGDWSIANLAVGATETLTLEGLIAVSAAGQSINNITTAATSDLSDNDTVGDQLTAGVNVNAATPDSVDLPNQCGAFTSRGWLTFGATRTDSTQIPGTGDPTSDFYLYLPLTRLPSGEVVSYFGAPDENVTGTVPSPPGSNLISTNINNPGHQSEYHVSVIRLEGAANTSETITLETAGAHDWTAYWIEDSSGTVIDSADFVFTAVATATGSVGPDLPVTINYPNDEVVYLHVAMFDPTGGYGPPRIRDYTCPEADLLTVKTLASGNATPDIGDIVTFDIAVTNNGPSDALNTSLTDLLPAGLTATANNGTVTAGTYDSATGEWSIASLANGATATLTLEGTADLAAAGTTITNITTVATSDIPDSNPAGDMLEASVDVLGASPAMTLTKTASNDTDVKAGDVITYTYVVENTGNVEMSDVSITDVHSGTGTLGAITPATVATVAVGESVSFTADYTVTQADIDAGTAITNTATSAATPAGGTYTPVSVDESISPEAAAPAATMVKTPSITADAAEGDVITYTYVVTNTGNVTLTDVTVSDVHSGTGTLGAITPATVASLAIGDSATFTADYTVTQADVDAGADITNDASMSAVPPTGTPVTDSASVSVESIPPAPASTLTKTASNDTDVAVGDVITYTYEFTNTGNVSLSDVSVSDVHSGTGTLGAITPATVATVAVGESVSFTADYTVTQADIDAGTAITNTATSAATPAGGTYTPVSVDESISPEAATAQMTLAKTASQTSGAEVGDVITYSYAVENTGNVTMNNVSITDVHSGSGSLSAITPAVINDFAPGATATFTATYTVTQADVDAATDITNEATLNGAPERGSYTPAVDTEAVSLEAPSPAMTLAKTASQTSGAAVGDVITYTYAVENTGNVTMNNVTISDVHLGSGTLSGFTPANISALAVGATASFTATYTVTQADIDAGTDITNTATVNAEPAAGSYSPVTDDAVVSPNTGAPEITFTKTASDTSGAVVGDIITYTYTAENTGNVTINDVSVSDVHSGAGTLSPITPAVVASLAVGQTATFTAAYEIVQADIDAGTDITNTASVTATPSQGSLPATTDDAQVTPAAAAPSLTLDKRAVDTDFAAVGDVVSYEYDVENTGNVTVSALTVSDDKIANVVCPVAVLAPGATTTCTADYTVTQVDLNAGLVTNNASVDGAPAGGTLTPAEDSVTINGTQSPSFTLAKTAVDTDFAAVGDVLSYEYLVTNTGNVEITAIAVSDDKIAAVNCPATSLMPSESVTCTASYAVTQADIDAGSVTNVAQAAGTPAGGTLSPVSATETVSATQNPALSLVKTALTSSFGAVGDTLDYSYVVTNSGNVTIISPITVADDKIAPPSIVSCPALPAGGLAPNASLTCNASYVVTQADLDAGSVTNVASASDGFVTSPTDKAVVNAAQNPSMTLVKTAVESDFATVGDIVNYEYTVTNTGNVYLENLSVTDNLISNVICNVPAVGNGDARLDPNEVVVCIASYSVTQADIDAGSVTNTASADAAPAGGSLTPPSTSATVSADQMPSFTLNKNAVQSSYAAVGDVLSYTYELINTGNVSLSNVVVTDDKISTVSCDVTAAGNGDNVLDPSESVICIADYTVTQADIDAGSVTNNAAANAAPAGGTLAPATDSAKVDAVQSPAMTMTKDAVDVNFDLPGDITTYEYVVTNTGNTTLTSPITVSDNRISNVNCPALPAGGLAPAASLTCTATYAATQADLDAGSVTNVATASSGPISAPTVSETIPADQSPALSVVKTAISTDFAAAGESVDYSFTVTNDGNITLTGLTSIEDDKIGTINCFTGNIVPGGSETCTASYVITQADVDAGFVKNQAYAENGSLVSAPVNATIDAVQTPSIDFAKRAVTSSFTSAGDVISYEFDVQNTGNVTLSGISLSDDLIASVSCPQTTLAPNASMVCSASYSVSQADVDAGSVTNNAAITANPPNGAPAISEPSSAVVDSDSTPSMSFTKRALTSDFSMVGDVLSYEFDVANTGPITLSKIVITDSIIASVSCPRTTLAPAETMVCSANYSATQDDVNAGQVTNTATAAAELPNGAALPSVEDTVVIDGTQTPEMFIDKTANDTSFAAVGDTLSYTYVVRNTGNVTLTAISVTDDKIPSLSCPATTLAPGTNFSCSGTYTVTQADIDAGGVTNIAQATATSPAGAVPPATDSAVVNSDQAPALSLVKTAITADYNSVGSALEYEYVVTNTGNVTLTDPITVTDDKIASVDCPALPAGGLTPDASLTCTATYNVTQADIDAGSVTNVASASNGTVTSPSDDAVVDAAQAPAMAMTKTATPQTFASVGESVSYEYVITNTGNITLTEAITVSDDRIASVSCPALPAGGLVPGAALTCTATDTVTQADLDAGTITNTASASDGTTSSAPVTETVSADQAPLLAIEKNALSIDYAAVGDTLDYEYIVTNTGNVTITEAVSVTDDKIASVSCPALPAGGLAPAASLTCIASYAVTQADIDNGEVINVATAATPSLSSAPDTATVDSVQTPALSIEKTAAQSSFAAVGDVLSYEYLVTNTGNVTLSGAITVSDDRISSVVCPSLPASGLAPNQTLTCTANYVVAQADIDAGVVTNVASAANGNTVSAPDQVSVNADQNPELTTLKAAQSPTFDQPGQVIDYTYTVINSGNVTITNAISVSDDKIASVSCPALPAGGLVPSAQIVCTASYAVTQADIDAGEVVNVATSTDESVTSAPVTESVTATQNPSMDIAKSAVDVNFTLPGDITSYEYVVTNTGNVSITAPITVSDNLISNVSCPALPAGGLLPNASLTCTAQYAATQSDLDIGSVTNIASATDGNVTTAADSATIPANAQPAIVIRKASTDAPFTAVGQTLTYSYEIENMGNVTLSSDFNVVDNKIGTFVCFSDNLTPGQIESCTATYDVTQADIDAGFVTNDAYVMNDRASSPPVSVTLPAEQLPALDLVKTAETDDFAQLGDTLEYSYVVTNTGNTTITLPISIADDRIADVVCPALPSAGLAPTESLTCTASDVVTQADLDAGSVTNTATATDGNVTSEPQIARVNGTQTPTMALEKVALSSTFAALGDTLDYSYVVTNDGNVTLTEAISIEDDKIGTISCPALPAGGLLPNQTLTCTASYTVVQADLDAGSVTNIASATDGTVTSLPDEVTVTGAQNPALALVKTADQTEFAVIGNTLSYVYEVTNTGNVTITEPITVSDDKIASVSCPALPAGGLAPSQSISCSASYDVTQADIDAGFVTNIASASDGTAVSPDATATVDAAQNTGLSLAKTALTTEFAQVGDTLDYEYVVTNTGNVTLTTAITITDDRIAAVNCPALPAGGLAPSASITCTGQDSVTQADLDAGLVKNIASASNGDITSNTASVVVTGEQNSGLSLEKLATTSEFSSVGDILSYDFNVTNTGNVTLTTPITIDDDKIGAISCPALPAGGLLPGATHLCRANYSVTQTDVDAGVVTNIARAISGDSASAPDTATVNGRQAPQLSLVKSANTDEFNAAGDIISYSYLITNIGNVTLTDALSVSDDKIGTITCPAASAVGFQPDDEITCQADYVVTQVDIDAGFVTNIATATDGTSTSNADEVTVQAVVSTGLSIVKRATTDGFAVIGDIVSYEYDVTNIGNATLTTPISVSDDKIADVVCPALPADGLAPQGTVTCQAQYTVVQADIDAGSVTNIASAASGNVTSETTSATVEAQRLPQLSVTKSVASLLQIGGPIYDVTYQIALENTGNVTLTNVQLEDNLAAALAPAEIYSEPSAQISGFTGGAVNTAYNGSSNSDLFSGVPQLAVGEAGLVTLIVRIDISNGSPILGNTAIGSAAELSEDVPSNDPLATPATDDDIQPAVFSLVDTDGDGAADNLESSSVDRDGDGIPDSEDYDPTGYFYCEENGAILSGGGISISGPNGVNNAVGTANNIVIVNDGSDGFYQFYVTAPGRYRLTPSYPSGGVPSTTRLVSSETLDATSLLPDNPASLGSSEVGTTGVLADASLSANPEFFFEFDFEAGDPAIFMNNIPLQHCGNSQLSLTKSVIGEPVTQDDGRQLISYGFEISNTGETLVENVQLSDDLGDVYGDANVTVAAKDITDWPTGFAGDVNTAYDGVTDISVLDGLGALNVGETITVELQALIAPQIASTFINKATAVGENPLTRAALSADDTASIELIPSAKVSDLIIRKSANPRTVQIGDPVLYTIDVTNSGIGPISNIDIIDQIPAGFSYIPNTATLSDSDASVSLEPTVASRSVLGWTVGGAAAAPLDTLNPGETLSVNLHLLAGPNVEFGAHENQAYAVNNETGERSNIATAIVDYIPEPSFDCTPVIGRVYDDVNHNGYPDDGEPGLPAVRLITVNGDIITTDQYGRYHIPCAIIANSERGSNFLLKTDVRSLPLGYSPTTENPRVVRATRGKFVKMNFGAAHRPKLRIDLFTTDFFPQTGLLQPEAEQRITALLQEDLVSDRAILVYHADDLESVDTAQAALKHALGTVKAAARDQLKDIALEASWGDAKAFTRDAVPASGQFFDRPEDSKDERERVAFFANDNGELEAADEDEFNGRGYGQEAGLRGGEGSQGLESDTRRAANSFGGRRDNGEAESARPGRLLRWIGWGNKTSSYAEGLEIETTSTALNVMKRLNAHADVVSTPAGRIIHAESYWNYDAFIERAELRIFDADKSTRGEPFAAVDFVDGEVRLHVNAGDIPSQNTPENMVYVLRAYAADGSFDETAAKTLVLGDGEFDLTEDEWAREAQTIFGHNTLLIDSIRVRGGSVRVYGRNVPGETVRVMGQSILVDDDGKFVSEQILPKGEQSLEVIVAGENGGENRILRSVDVKDADTFYVAQVEATVGQNIAEDAAGDRSFEEGRVAFYIRSRLNDRWAITATADTGEAELENLLSGLDDKDLSQLLRRLDPDRFYPTYGDDSTIEQDAPTSGKFYARIERDDDYALWGNYQTNFNDTEYARIQRTLYGAKLNWDQNGDPTKYGDDRTSLTAFIAQGGSSQGRDELRGTGGSVYYLRNGDIAIGSEILRIETRDRVSGLVFESRRLTYGADYEMDFIQGRVILNQPLGSTADDGRLFRDDSLSGDEVVLVVDYEYTPITGTLDNSAIYGARGTRWFGDHVKLGATYNHDTDGGAESDLYEVDLTLQYAAGTYIKGEVARTKGQGVETFQSIDGGFTYNPLARGGLVDNSSADAYAVEAAVDFNEVDGINLDATSYAYWRRREAGFAGYSEATNQTIEQFGGGLSAALSDNLTLTARADVSDDFTVGTNSFAEATIDYKLDEKITISAGGSFNDDARGNSGTSLGGRIDYDVNDDSSVYAFGQVGIQGDNQRTTDRVGLGAEVRLSNKIFGGGEISTGEDGLGARASLRYEHDNGDESYLAYDLPLNSQAQSNLGTINLGARRRFTDALSVFGEERLQLGDTGVNGLTHAYGVDYKPGNWNLGLAAEVGRIDNLDREAFSANVGFASDRIKAGVTGEWREDENVETGDERRTWLLRSTASYLASEELSLQGKLNLAFSDQSSDDPLLGPQTFNEAEFTEASLSAAYRPIWDDRFNLLAKLVWLEDLSPTSQRFNGESLNYRQKSTIASVDGSYDISPRFTLGGKYAYRSGSVTSSRESLDFTESEAELAIARLDFHATHKWDATVELRRLDIGNGTITRDGGLAGVYRHVNDNAKIGVGLTWGGIEEEYLAPIGREDDLGWYVNVIGKF